MNTVSGERKESFDLARRLLQVVDMITKLTENSIPEGDTIGQLRLNQIRTMYMLWYAPGIAQKDLATRLQITPAAVSLMVRDMEATGLLDRQPNPADARQMKLYLSEHGERVIAESEDMRRAAVASMLDALPVEQQRTIVELLERAFEITQNGNGS